MKASTTITHDRMTLRVSLEKSRINLTWSRYADRLIATVDLPNELVDRIGKAWSALRTRKGDGTLQARIDEATKFARSADTFEEFARDLTAWAAR